MASGKNVVVHELLSLEVTFFGVERGSALQAKKAQNFIQALQLELLARCKREKVARCRHSHEGLVVVAGDGQGGQAVLGHHCDVLSSSKGKSGVHCLRLQNEVLLLLLSHKSVHCGVIVCVSRL